MRMPTCLVVAMLTMLPRLGAEESIMAANRIAVGGGKLKREDAGRITSAWSAAAQPDAASTRAVDRNALTSVGIKVRRAKRTKKP